MGAPVRPGVVGGRVEEQVEPPLSFSGGPRHPVPHEGTHQLEPLLVVPVAPEAVTAL